MKPMVVKPVHALVSGDTICLKGLNDEIIFTPILSTMQSYNGIIISTPQGSFTLDASISVPVFINVFA